MYQICEIRYMSSEDKKPAKNRAKFVIGAAARRLYLCSREPRGRWGTFPGQTGVLYHSGVRTLYAKGIFREKLMKIINIYKNL